MGKERETELRRIQDMAIRHTVEQMDAADTFGLDCAKDRGDRGFLTSMAAKSMGVAVRIEQYVELCNRSGLYDLRDQEEQDAARDRMISKARAEVKSILERASDGTAKPKK